MTLLSWFRIDSFLHNHKTEIIIFFSAFVVRAIYATLVQVIAGADGFIAWSDAEYFYYREGLNLLNHQALSLATDAPYYPDAYHTPIYSLLLAGLFFLKIPLFGVALVQAVIAGATAVLIYWIAIKLAVGRRIAIAASLLVALEPMSIFWSSLLMSDVLFAFFIVLCFYLFMKDRFVAMAFVLGAAALTRPIALLFAPFFILFVSYRRYTATRSLRVALMNAAVVTVIVAAIVSVWFARNKVVFDTWDFTSAGWYDLYVIPVSEYAEKYSIPLPEVKTTDREITDFRRFNFEYTPMYQEAVFKVAFQNPLQFVVFQIQRSMHSLVSSRYEYLLQSHAAAGFPAVYAAIAGFVPGLLILGQVLWASVYVLAALAFKERSLRSWLLFLAALIGVNAAISGGINPRGTDMSRYAMPLDAMLFIFAGVGFTILVSMIRERRLSVRSVLQK